MSNIILVGYMGCGKTTVGKNLARNCHLKFIDSDNEIEKKYKRTISDIFAQDGEEAFRDMETAYLEELLAKKKDGMVLSTGGGMALRERNRELLKQIGEVVYLEATPEVIYERVKNDTKRPLLQCEDPLAKIREMIAVRTPFYEAAATSRILVDELKQSEIAFKIQEMMEES